MRGWIAGQVAVMHADGSIDAHEPMHVGTKKMSAGRRRIFSHIDILGDDVATAIHIGAIDGRAVIFILLADAEETGMRVMPLSPGGDGGEPHQLSTFKKGHTLLIQTDDDFWAARHRRCGPPGTGWQAGFWLFNGRCTAIAHHQNGGDGHDCLEMSESAGERGHEASR